uniref:Uncharacterized protein n=1 Tax=Anguilla anguilla TaxID=7936 RepID=A0A0E9P6X8_ANGAN
MGNRWLCQSQNSLFLVFRFWHFLYEFFLFILKRS